jgi:hypothetical protein
MGNNRGELRAHQRGVSGWAALFGLIGIGLLGYWLYPRGNPSSPYDLAPYGTLLIGDIPTSSVTLRWIQGGFVRALQGPSPGRATRFLVCIYESGSPHDCASGTGTLSVSEAEAHTIPRHELRSGDWKDWGRSKLAPRFAYEYAASLPQTVLDIPVDWQVGACGGAANTTCTFSEVKTLAITARDLAVDRIDDDISGQQLELTVDVRNDGRTTGESYQLDTRVWEVLLQPRSGVPLTDLSNADVRDDDVVITTSGETLPVSDYRSRNLPADQVSGIHRAGFFAQGFLRQVPEVPAPKPAGQPLITGECAPGQPAGQDPCNRVHSPEPACEPAPCLVSPTRHPSVFVGYATVNSGGVPWDFETGDNGRPKNGMYVP